MMRRRHSMHASMLSTGSLLTPTLPSPTALLTPDFLAAQDLRERSKSPAPANMNLMRSKSPIPLRRCKSPQPPIGRCKSPAPLALVEEEQHEAFKHKLAEDRHTAFLQRLQKLEDKGHEPREIMPAPVVLVLADKFTAFGGQTSSSAYVVSNILATAGCRVYCTSTIPDGHFDAFPEEKRGENIQLIRALPGHEADSNGPLEPRLDWISTKYKTHFPTITRPPEEASHIVGIAPTTAETAFNLQAIWWQDHKVRVKVILVLPTKITDPEAFDDVRKWAFKADTVYSVGPKLKNYYDEVLSERKDIDIHKHRMFAYRPKALELEDRPPNPFEVVSFYSLGSSSEINTEVKKDFKSAAKAFANICSVPEVFNGVPPQWILFTNHDGLDTKALSKDTYSFDKRPPLQTKEEVFDHLFPCSLILAPETDGNGFNFEAWEALGAGYPTLVTAMSGVGQLLRHEEVMNLYSSRSVAFVAGHSEILKDFLQQHFVKRPDLAGENSRLLGDELRASEFLCRMEAQFLDTFTKGTVLDEELKALMFRRQTSDELMKVNKLVKLCTRHGKELGLFCRRCKEPLCITCSDEEKHDKHKSDITHLSGFYSYFYRYTEMKTEKKLSSLQSSSAVGDTTKDLRMRLSDCDTVRATIGVHKHALDTAVTHVAEREKFNVIRLNEIRKHIDHITSEIEESIQNMTESEKNKLLRFSVHVDDILKEIMEVKDTGSSILDRQSDQTKIHNALEFLDNFESRMGEILGKMKVLRSWRAINMETGARDEEVKSQVQRLVGKLSFKEMELPLPKLHETQMKVVNDADALVERPPEIVIDEENGAASSSPTSTMSPTSPSINGIDEDQHPLENAAEPKTKEKKKKKDKKEKKKEKEKDKIVEDDTFDENENEELKKFKKSKSRSNRRMSYML